MHWARRKAYRWLCEQGRGRAGRDHVKSKCVVTPLVSMFKTCHKGVNLLCSLWILFQWSMLVNYVCSPAGEGNKWNISNDLQYFSTHTWARVDSGNSSVVSIETTPSLASIRICVYSRYLFSVAIPVAIGWKVFPFGKKPFLSKRECSLYIGPPYGFWQPIWISVREIWVSCLSCSLWLRFRTILAFSNMLVTFLKACNWSRLQMAQTRTVQMKFANLVFQWISQGQPLSL